MNTNSLVYRALVVSSSSTTGQILVSIPSITNGMAIEVSKVGRQATNNVWPVPAVGTQIWVTFEDQFMSQCVWFDSGSPSDHGGLSGLADDDHPQYMKVAGGNFTGPITVSGNTVWNSANDGAASGLDADLLDGQHGAYYLPATNYVKAATASPPSSPSRGDQWFDTTTGSVLVYYGATTGWQRPWNRPWGQVFLSSFFDVDITGTSETTATTASFTHLANRLYKLSWFGDSWFGSANGDNFSIDITRDSTTVVTATSITTHNVPNYVPPGVVMRQLATTNTNHTWRCLGKRTGGSGTFRMRGYLLIEDMGPSGNAPSA